MEPASIDNEARDWPSFGEVLESLNGLDDERRSQSETISRATKDSEETPEFVSYVPGELPPAEFDTSVLEFAPSAPIAELDESALDALAPPDDVGPPDGEEQSVVDVFDQDAVSEPMIVELDTAEIEEEPENEAAMPSQPEINWTSETDIAETDIADSGEGELAEVIEHRFDSVATADAIESDLNDLFSDSESADSDHDDSPQAEVVQLHASPDDIPENIVGLDDAFGTDSDTEPSREWIGVGEDDAREDPWAYMRPDDSSSDGNGFWANRPKFFGGEERKRRRAARKTATVEVVQADGPICPNCFESGQVDLDDPIGAKLHASCTSCDHVWSVAYEADQGAA